MSFKAQRAESVEQSINPSGGAVQDGPDFEQEGRAGKFPLIFPISTSPLRKWTPGGLVFAIKDKGLTAEKIAKFNDLQAIDVRHFINKRFNKISRRNKARLLQWFRDAGFLPRPTPKQRHRCPICGATHIIKGSSHV